MILEDELFQSKFCRVVDGMQLKVSNKGNDAPGNSVPGFNCSYRRART
jgi:molecular chaperone DnaJ